MVSQIVSLLGVVCLCAFALGDGGYGAPGPFGGHGGHGGHGVHGGHGSHGGHQGHYHHHPYDYGYGVADPHTGTDFGHQETSEHGVVSGRYHVLLPDGRRQIVTYTADREHGYQAHVAYEGTAHHPEHQHGHHGGHGGGHGGYGHH